MAKVMNPEPINDLIHDALRGSRKSQQQLYQQYYGYGMSVCIRYARNREEAQEMLNDGFLKVFRYLDRFDFQKPFKFWLRRILINASIDYLRRQKRIHQEEIVDHDLGMSEQAIGLDRLSANEILAMVQRLAPSYRAVFNLFVVEGFSHQEIADELGISVGTSKSNLAVARKQLKVIYSRLNQA